MTEQTQTKLERKFDWDVPGIRTSFVQGEEASVIYDFLGDYITQLGGISYDSETNAVRGSHPLLSARVDTLVRPLGVRVTNLRDLSRPEVMNKIKGKHYSDAPVLVLRGMEDSYERNNFLIKRIAEEVEEKNRKLELPVMISGFDFKPWPEDDKGYGIDIVPRDDFIAIHDKRLKGENDIKKFSEVDELGLPEFDKNGIRTFYARNQGLSGLYLSGVLDFDSNDENLAYSNSSGRVVLVSAEGANENFLGDYQLKFNEKREQFEAKKEEYVRFLKELRGEIDQNLDRIEQ